MQRAVLRCQFARLFMLWLQNGGSGDYASSPYSPYRSPTAPLLLVKYNSIIVCSATSSLCPALMECREAGFCTATVSQPAITRVNLGGTILYQLNAVECRPVAVVKTPPYAVLSDLCSLNEFCAHFLNPDYLHKRTGCVVALDNTTA